MKVPAILIEGASDNNQAADLVVRYRIDGTTDWSYQSAPVGLGGILITGVVPDTLYNVELGYRSVDGIEPTSWTAFGDVTPDLPDIDTPDIELEAAAERDQQVQVNGWGGTGALSIAYDGGGVGSTYTQLDEYAFTYGGTGAVFVQWHGMVQWQANSAKKIWMYLCVDGAPFYSGFEQGYEIRQEHNGNQNNLTTTVVLSANLTGLSTAAHTIEIYGKCTSNANMPYLDIGSTTKFEIGKR